MDPKRVLIVEPDNSFALSLASLFQEDGHGTGLAASAADAEREIEIRRPDLLLMRAELPDQSGFSLCARLRKDRDLAWIPIILFSSESSQEALAEHARTPAAANGYLGMPLDTAALVELARQLLTMGEPTEIDDVEVVEVEQVVETAPPVEVRLGQAEVAPEPSADEVDQALEGATTPSIPILPEAEQPAPPPVPHRPSRSNLNDEDRIFLERAFRSIREIKTDLLAESHRRRPPPRRDLFATPEGRAQLLREDLRWREAQIARISELWEIRERGFSQGDERIHEKEVESQAYKLQVEDLLRRLAEARDLFLEKEREHGASIDGLLLEKFGQEKDLIEVVAGNERKIHELEREVRLRDDDLAQRKMALDSAHQELERLEKQGQENLERFEERERELKEALTSRETELAASEKSLAESQSAAVEAERVHGTRLAEVNAARQGIEEHLEAVRAEREEALRAAGERLTEVEVRAGALEQKLEEAHSAAQVADEAHRARVSQLEEQVAIATRERDEGEQAAQAAGRAFQERVDERERFIKDREERIRALEAELRGFREQAKAREEDLSREIQDHIEQIGSLEGEIEGLDTELADREAELQGQIRTISEKAAMLERDLEATRQAGQDFAGKFRESREAAAKQAEEAANRESALSKEIDEARAQVAQLIQAVAERDQLLTVARGENDRLEGELSKARQAAMVRESELQGEVAAAQTRVQDMTSLVAQVTHERDDARAQIMALSEEVDASRGEAFALGEEVREARSQAAARDEALQKEAADVWRSLEETRGALDAARKEAQDAAAAGEARVREFTGALAAERESRQQAETDLHTRLAKAEKRAAEVAARADKGDEQRAEELKRLRSALQEAVRRAKMLEMELAKLKDKETAAPAASAPEGEIAAAIKDREE